MPRSPPRPAQARQQPAIPIYGCSTSSFYYGCDRSDCKGERIWNFNTCIVHLSPQEEEQYANNLRAGQGELVISAVKVDMKFVEKWIDRISTSANGSKVVAVPVRMQETEIVGSLGFHEMRFNRGLNLTKITAYGVRLTRVHIEGELRLEEAVLQDECTLAGDFQVDDLLLSSLEAKHFNMFEGGVINGRVDARQLSVEYTLIRNVEFRGDVNFNEASLCDAEHTASISAEFQSLADFSACKLFGETQLGRQQDVPPTKFLGEAKFDGAIFGSESFGALTMTDCLFQDVTTFENAEGYGCISFNDARFAKAANLNGLKIRDAPSTREHMPAATDTPPATFTMCRTQIESSFSLSADVDGTAVIEEITFPGVVNGFSVSATRTLRLSLLTVETFASLAVSSNEGVIVDQCQMRGGGELKVAGDRISMTNFACAKPVLAESVADQRANKPKLTTLKGTNCDGLTLSGFDYSETRFLGAAKLDSLIITGEFTLHSTSGARARRAVLVEEAAARASKEHWSKLVSTSGSSNDSAPELRQLAGLYRSLRKAREDQKDEPGSADFYYGEMEMRRLSSPRKSMERIILTAYWLMSGYGLRAWRAIALLTLLIVGSAIALSRYFPLGANDPEPPSVAKALLFSAQSGLSLSGPASLYSPAGQVVQLVLRIGVPILIALAVLAVRGRVKR